MIKTYTTDRLVLKVLRKDAAAKVLHFYDSNRSIFEPWEPARSNNFYTLHYQKALLNAEYNLMLDRKLLRYWVFLKENSEEIVGTICFQNFLREPYLSCSLGYKFSSKYHHQGFAYESISKAIQIIFQEKRIHRIEAYIMPNNEPSIGLIEKLNFQYEGISYSYAKINGIWQDHKRYSYINPDDINR